MPNPAADGVAFDLLAVDPDEVGYTNVLGVSMPLVRLLLRFLADSEGEQSCLNIRAPSGAWIGVAVRPGDTEMTISTDHGQPVPEPYSGERHTALVSHGFQHVPARTYTRRISFATDEGLELGARVITGTFQHVWAVRLQDVLDIELRLAGSRSPVSADPGESSK